MSEREAQGTVLCLGSEAKGRRLLQELFEQGCRVLLLTLDSLEHAGWPRETLAEVVTVPAGLSPQQICARVSQLARHHRIDRVLALSARDLETAAMLREHMRLPGMGQSTARLFSDRLAMRKRALRAGVATAEFCPVLNHDDLRLFMEQTPGPWLLTPRAVGSTEPSRMIDRPQRLWRLLDELGDAQSNYLLERALRGTRYFVEAVSWGRRVLLSRALRCLPEYDASPVEVLTTQLSSNDSADARRVLDAHDHLLQTLGMAAGITHAEFLDCEEYGSPLFLEVVAGAGPALSAEVVAAATGVDLWVEWGNIEAAVLFGEEYQLPRIRQEFAAGAAASSRGPLTGELDAPEVFFLEEDHTGVVFRSRSAERVARLLLDAQDS